LSIISDKIVYILTGRMKIFSAALVHKVTVAGEFLFVPAALDLTYEVTAGTSIILFLISPVRACGNLTPDMFYSQEDIENLDTEEESYVLDANERMIDYIEDLRDNLISGIKCRGFYEFKVSELLILLRAYYPKNELAGFFRFYNAIDSEFSEYVSRNWRKYRTVKEFAASMLISQKHFAMKFKKIFKKTPYKWMLTGRSHILYQELVSTSKPFKNIAYENGFSTISQFNKFCKKELGETPTVIRFGNK